MIEERMTGQVKWFDPKKGYGFIQGPQGHDVFIHYSQIGGSGFRSLRDGEEVTYELTEGEKGLQARTVLRSKAEEEAQSHPREDEEDGGRYTPRAQAITQDRQVHDRDVETRAMVGYSNSYRGR